MALFPYLATYKWWYPIFGNEERGTPVAEGRGVLEHARPRFAIQRSMTESDSPRQEPVERDDTLGPELQECPVCLAIGLPERIENHDCNTFLERLNQRSR